jgi:sugar lactone lactonase YvrE
MRTSSCGRSVTAGDTETERSQLMSRERDGRRRTDYTRRTLLKTIPLVGAVGVGSGTVSAGAPGRTTGTTASRKGSGETFPEVVDLPEGFQPEGIATGRGTTFFVGSLATGNVYRGDLRTGEGEVFVEDDDNQTAVGLSYDRRSDNLFVAGDETGAAYVYDAETGETVEVYQLADPGPENFVNDVVVTRDAAYFTDSFQAVLYRLPLGPGGRLPDADAVETIELTGEFEFVPGEGVFNANGIDASPNGTYLIVVNSTTGLLYKVDPSSGDATEIDLGGETVKNGDGILLDGNTLYVVRNRDDLVAVVELEPGATAGEVVREITDPEFRVPTTVAEFGSSLYAVNARFGTSDPENAEYEVVRVPKR